MLDPAPLFWLHIATASCQMPSGIITIAWVVLLRHQNNPNAGIFTLAAKVGIGSVANKRSDHIDPTVYFDHPQIFDLLWVLNHVVVIIITSILLGFSLGHTQEGIRVMRADLVNVTNALWVYRTLLAVSQEDLCYLGYF
ncbi:hypothetical protein B0T25DRAFT_223613 [Lasiosphaeria hispida]|uniref:Uncharacterized protein n=1 Tax=Lasiosphaeria hispida TaxID=260671 RepID=A0AAJ0MEX7_9PEZI|nr:hypothetical protein B0T25DRAFT_223613 [Lasiosphaeria hispida]